MKKGHIIGAVSFVLGAVLMSVFVLAASVGSEASKMDTMLKDDVAKHMSFADVKAQLAQAGYATEGELPNLKATGPKHSLVVYATWLYVNITFDQAGAMNGYHLDRAG